MGVGIKELLVILLIALVVFGTKRLRNIGSDLGGAIKSFRGALNESEEDKAAGQAQTIEGEASAEKGVEKKDAPAHKDNA